MERSALCRIRKAQVLVMAALTSVAYLMNGVAMIFSVPSDENSRLQASQVAMKNAFHGLLVVGVSGLYVAQRNKIWLFMAAIYIPLTTIACGTCLSTHRSDVLAIVVVGVQLIIYCLFGGSIFRFKQLSVPGCDDFNVTQTLLFSDVPAGIVKGCLVVCECCMLCVVVAEIVIMWLDKDVFADPFSCSVHLIESSAHHAVIISVGLFCLSRRSQPLRLLFCYTGIVVGVSRLSPHPYVGSFFIVAGLMLIPVAAFPGLWAQTVSVPDPQPTNRRSVPIPLPQTCAIYLHGFSWWFEALYGSLVALQLSGTGSVIHIFAKSSVSGAHAAVLMGLQRYKLESSLSIRANFHIVVGLMYSVTAAGTLASCLNQGRITVPLLVTSIFRLFSMGYYTCSSVVERSAATVGEMCESDDSHVSDGEVEEAEIQVSGAADQKEWSLWPWQCFACFQTVLITVNVCIIALVDQFNLLGSYQQSGTHTSSEAIIFHFGFLYSVHSLAAALYFRRISLSFVLHGTPFILAILFIIVIKVPQYTVLFLPLFTFVAANCVSLCVIQSVIDSHPSKYTDGNIDW
eukprot:TRINITY_DN5627_c1_g1_i5.p1 TRINITY_DN5627_c1_g1~~TRINITY_DN5627_c1_g1_i5.p1  ORF type:complete len:570 (+),score=42.61 TRINITY_DN5627_c1_g1_i5:534-2243(+)